jgi:hypothetical protein
MVLFGYPNSISEMELHSFLENQLVRWHEECFKSNNFVFAEVESQELLRTGMCILGKHSEWESMNQIMQKPVMLQKMQIEVLKRFISDMEFWMNFLSNGATKFGSVAIRRQYMDVPDIDNGIVNLTLKTLGFIDLLKIEVNQTLLITQ